MQISMEGNRRKVMYALGLQLVLCVSHSRNREIFHF